MNKDQLKTAFAKGARIQAWRLNEGAVSSMDGFWDTFRHEPAFTCPLHLYRVHPEDLSLIAELGQEVGAVADSELPGMWSASDFTGGDPDERCHAEREPVAAQEAFTAWFCLNYPGPHTIISDPNWHAPRIFRQAQWAIKQSSPAHTSEARDGVSLIAAERRRQMESEGWSLEHDDAYEINELACAAACYVVPPQFRDPLTIMAELWPWDESWWKPGDRIRELAKAGALIAAEIDRLERAAMRQEGGDGA